MYQQTTTQDARQQQQLRDEIRQSINAARDAARDAAQEASGSGRNVIVQRIPAVPPLPPAAPGFTIQNGYRPDDIPPGVKDLAIGFMFTCAVIVIGWPIARAFGRRIDRRPTGPAALPSDLSDQLHRIEQAVDAMSIEVERISESQRFMAKLQHAERVPLPAEKS